jgi:hypothetical protein
MKTCTSCQQNLMIQNFNQNDITENKGYPINESYRFSLNL